ncbi:histone H4 [Leishmania tarentolae]|uniref:Histone H4 n=1 Tax=Leishmania tarentolae TaxID=5689 RepID=A0A640KT14_LEITA|nr:histone H4 [Leishmania tarentolae]
MRGGVESQGSYTNHFTKKKQGVSMGVQRICGCLRIAVQDLAALAQRVHDIRRRHRLLACVLGVGRAAAHNVLHVGLQHTAHLLVDLARDALHATTARHAADAAARDAADVVAQHLLLALLAALGISGALTLGHG